MSLRSEQFDDIYFSPEDGLAETRHVFLGGNDLPAAWEGRERFTIEETGFGTGLNFLAAWTLFEETAAPGQRLDYISFEKYPISAGQIEETLNTWRGVFGGRLERLLRLYPIRAPGFHRVVLNDRVSLTLVFGDVNAFLPQLEAPGGVDAWFLDGFAPAKNPDMWTEAVFSSMARLSRKGTSFATFTAAGAVRRGLEAAGFTVEKRRGYGRKRDMLAGRFEGRKPTIINNSPRVAIIGGGLAGTACAYTLRQKGLHPVIYESEGSLAKGASGNLAGMVNPRFQAGYDEQAAFYITAFALALRTLGDMPEEAGWRSCGSLHLMTDEDKERRFNAVREAGIWPEEHLRLLDPAAASEQAGIPIDKDALYLPDAGTASPAALCRAYAVDTDIRYYAPVSALRREDGKWLIGSEAYDAVILACAAGARSFEPLSWLPVHTVRGQVTLAAVSGESAKLQTNLCYGGYISPACNGLHAVGSTFQKWLEDTDVKEEDHRENFIRLAEAVPALREGLKVAGGRAALRTSSQDRFPVIGRAPDKTAWEAGGEADIEGLYVSTAHGSHGIISTLAGAHLLADMIAGTPYSLPVPVVDALSPARFLKRMRRRGAL